MVLEVLFLFLLELLPEEPEPEDPPVPPLPPGDEPPEDPSITDIPKTGDTSHILFYTMLMFASGIILILLGIMGREDTHETS